MTVLWELQELNKCTKEGMGTSDPASGVGGPAPPQCS